MAATNQNASPDELDLSMPDLQELRRRLENATDEREKTEVAEHIRE